MKRTVVVGGLLAVGLGMAGLGGLQVYGSEREAIAAEASTPASNNPEANRDVFYFSDYGFRFVSPKGYTVVPSQEQPSGSPTLVQHLEIWNLGDYYNFATAPESPPILHIRVFDNAQRLPLRDWKGELSEEGDRPITVAGQEGLAYSATGLY